MNKEINTPVSREKTSEVFMTLFGTIGKFADKEGIKMTIIVTVNVLIVLVLLKNIIPVLRDTNSYSDIGILLYAIIISVVVLFSGSYEYRLQNEYLQKDKELLFEKYKAEMDFQIRRLELTQLPETKFSVKNVEKSQKKGNGGVVPDRPK